MFLEFRGPRIFLNLVAGGESGRCVNGKPDVLLEDNLWPSRNWSGTGGDPETLGWQKKKKFKPEGIGAFTV